MCVPGRTDRSSARRHHLFGTLSIFGTLVDHAAPADPSSSLSRTVRLAALDRELSFNDPDAENGEDGSNDARGERSDRNVELLVRNPYRW